MGKYVHHSRETAHLADFAHLYSQFLFPVLLILEIKSMHIRFKSVRIFETISGKTFQAQLGNCQNRNSHTSKIDCLLLVCLINSRHLADHISEQSFMEMLKNCVRNHSRPDEIDTETQICIYLKYFRFRWQPSIKSTLISYISVRVFVTIRRKMSTTIAKLIKNEILHISKIGNLFPVCIRKQQASCRPHFRAVHKGLWKNSK